jgi:SAM-dependent methyltransferase
MQTTTDWLELWRELAQAQAARWKGQCGAQMGDDAWRERARAYDAHVKAQWARPDSSRDFVVAQLKAHPGWTALDIGGGTGAWASLMAQHARHVTVVEPSPAMREVMRENLAAVGARNVTIVEGEWPDVEVGEYDLTLCAHAMYGLPDLEAFVRSLEAVTRELCVLLMRAPIPGGLMAQAAQHVWGQPHDSPNFQVAYNALLQLGIFADVLMENTGLWDPWTSPSLEEACAEIKRRLNIETDEHDAFLWDLVQRNLTWENGEYVWPRGVRSALVSWSVRSKS